jgi:hypothetical protein
MLSAVLGVAVAATLSAGGAVALADPGPNGNNTYGLCKAYFAGSANGQAHKHKAPPFAGLEAAADAADQTVAEYCAENGQHPGGK